MMRVYLLMKPRRHIPKRSYVVKAALRRNTENQKGLRLEFFPRGRLVFTRTGLFQCWGRPRWAHPPAPRRVSELERPQCNCPALGPFLLAGPPSPLIVRMSTGNARCWECWGDPERELKP